jgi:ribonuclease P protein component
MLGKKYRLTKRGSFNYVYRKGNAKNAGDLKITYVTAKGVPKVGISVPNTVGTAVVRNKVRRRIRAAMRGYVKNLRPSQIVISARKGAEQLAYSEIDGKLYEMLVRAGLYEKKETDKA